MTVTGQMKILNIKIMQNKVQHDLDRKIAKISAYLTGENLGLKPSTANKLNLSILHWVNFLIKG